MILSHWQNWQIVHSVSVANIGLAAERHLVRMFADALCELEFAAIAEGVMVGPLTIELAQKAPIL